MYLVLFCAVLMAAASCGGDDPDADPQPTTTEVPTTQSPEQADEEALRQLAEDWYEASDAIYQHEEAPNSAAQFLVDPYLSAYMKRAEDLVRSGMVSQPHAESQSEVLEVDIAGDRASIVECSVDADVLVNPDGSVVNDEVVALLLETDAVRVGDRWKLADRRTLVEVKGSDECPQQ